MLIDIGDLGIPTI